MSTCSRFFYPDGAVDDVCERVDGSMYVTEGEEVLFCFGLCECTRSQECFEPTMIIVENTAVEEFVLLLLVAICEFVH